MTAIDPEVFRAAQAGEPAALDALVRALQPDVRRYARLQCHRTSAVEDVVQEAMIVLYRRVGSIRDPVAVGAWLLRVIARLCMLPVLRLALRGAQQLDPDAQQLAHVPVDDLRLDLVRALESLPAMYREILLLRDMEQLTIGETAERLDITREAAKSRLHRARVLVREYLA